MEALREQLETLKAAGGGEADEARELEAQADDKERALLKLRAELDDKVGPGPV